jgi:hypothetical protein
MPIRLHTDSHIYKGDRTQVMNDKEWSVVDYFSLSNGNDLFISLD